ncbi:peptidoglycan DD-metalloendopeptidase family protein [Chryseobacterium limigenitum]|uniref:Muramidase (Phage lambda lysozyme) n=1 Tax=Chryseobacterium limigenitum TaxID=1612149 RepID=A0A1K2IP19_9FLAO|nr:peptidoglycan DD-metalloendopeptidase family protein [Chryseobacterium limigenitum]SFZ94196.1 Muramidase (phage lambda lysozyme) [Chryseobacterium limigenitum]
MSKQGVSKISGNPAPKVGEKTLYTIAGWYPSTPKNKQNPALVTWELFKKRSNGSFTTTNIKKKGDGNFTFGEVASKHTYRLEAYLYEPEGKGSTTIDITPQPSGVPKINKVELHYIDDSKGAVFSYTEKLVAKAQCVNLIGEKLLFTLWEDDAKGEGHNSNNLFVDSKQAIVGKNGMATAEFLLTKALMQKASKGETDPEKMEFYVMVEYYKNKKHATANIDVKNPEHKHKPAEQPKPAPKAPASEPQGKQPPKTKDSPVGQEPEAKAETKGTVEPQKPATQPKPEGKSTSVVDNVKVEGLLDAYFAKEEFKKETSEAAGQHQYTFQSNNNNIDKDKIAGIIKARVDDLVKNDKKYAKLEDIKTALTQTSYKKGESISVNLYKLGPEFVRINNAPLEEEVYVVARTMLLDGKEVSINIREKDAILVEKDANLPVLEGRENGNEITTLKATAQGGLAKVKIKLRPKSDENLVTWKDKLSGIKDGTHTYKFGSNGNKTATAEQKKKIAGIVANKIKDELEKEKKFPKIETIEKALTNEVYNKDQEITFDVYKSVTEYLWLKAECTGDIKKHNGEFLKKDGAYFEIGKKCECEARIRAFMRMLRVGEGTEGEKGYTTQYSGTQFSDMTKHPENVITAGDYSSSAAGAYQIMRYTWWWLKGEQLTKDNKKAGVYEEAHDYIKKYSVPDFTAESQDKLCILILKHKRAGSLPLITKNQVKEALEQYGSYEWASLPPGRYGQPAQTMTAALEKYDKFLKEELGGTTDLHLKKGFLKEFGIQCNCGKIGGSSEWHNPLDNMELRGWYSDTQWSPGKSDYHGRTGGKHDGLDLYAPVGTQIYACVDGEITYLEDPNGYGNRTFLEGNYNGQKYFFMYCHLSEYTTGQVSAGDPIGKTGQTGNASGQAAKMAHLHFEVRKEKMSKPSFNPLTEITELGTDVNVNPDQNNQTGT